ncbi:MAG: methyltransferase domain-containing protein [bacterium]
MAANAQKVRLHLGCGDERLEGWVNVDFHNPRADQSVDLFSQPWPWSDSSVDVVYMHHFLEHFPKLIETLREVHRILKPGGGFRVIVPYARGVHAHAIGHEQFFTYCTFEQLCNSSEWFARAHHILFEMVSYRVRLLKLPWLRWTPLDWPASHFPLFWEKIAFSVLTPTEIEWVGRAVK